MKVETIVRFHDLEAKCIREVGEEFEVSKERYKKLRDHGFVATWGDSMTPKIEPKETKPKETAAQ